jgi:hypothetical protein
MIAAVTVPPWMIEGLILSVVLAIGAFIVHVLLNSLKKWARGQFELVLHEVKPNGGDSDSNGDITKRTETKLDQHTELDDKRQKKANRETKLLRREVSRLYETIARVLDAQGDASDAADLVKQTLEQSQGGRRSGDAKEG